MIIAGKSGEERGKGHLNVMTEPVVLRQLDEDGICGQVG